MAAASVIGRGTLIRGNVSGDAALDVQGRVQGDVTMQGDVSVGDEARIDGKLTGAQVSIAGTVVGNVRGSEAVLVEPGARVVGDLSAPRIGVAEGALVRGNVRTDGEPELEVARRPAAAVRRPMPARAPVAAARPQPVAHKPAVAPVEAVARAPVPKPAPEPPKVEVASVSEPHLEAPKPVENKPAAPAPVVPVLNRNIRGKKKKAHRS